MKNSERDCLQNGMFKERPTNGSWIVEEGLSQRLYPKPRNCHAMDASRPGARKVVTGRRHFERLHGKKPTEEFVPFGERVLARQITTDPRNRMNPRCQCGVWLGMRNNSAECFIGNGRRCVQSARGQEDKTSRQLGQGGNHQRDRSPVENR